MKSIYISKMGDYYPMSTSSDNKKKRMIKALEKSLGIVSSAAVMAKIDRSLHYDWMKADPVYAEAVNSIGEYVLDFVETQLHKKIKDRDTAATIFYMKTKGKKRGYIERVENEISGRSGGPIVLNLDNDCKPIEGTGKGL